MFNFIARLFTSRRYHVTAYRDDRRVHIPQHIITINELLAADRYAHLRQK